MAGFDQSGSRVARPLSNAKLVDDRGEGGGDVGALVDQRVKRVGLGSERVARPQWRRTKRSRRSRARCRRRQRRPPHVGRGRTGRRRTPVRAALPQEQLRRVSPLSGVDLRRPAVPKRGSGGRRPPRPPARVLCWSRSHQWTEPVGIQGHRPGQPRRRDCRQCWRMVAGRWRRAMRRRSLRRARPRRPASVDRVGGAAPSGPSPARAIPQAHPLRRGDSLATEEERGSGEGSISAGARRWPTAAENAPPSTGDQFRPPLTHRCRSHRQVP